MKKVYLFATIFAVIAAFSIYKFAEHLEAISLPENVERTSVVVAARAIDRNSVITEEDLKVVQLPKEAVMSDAVAVSADVVGRLALDNYVANEQLLLSQTAGQGEKGSGRLSTELKEGEYAVTMDVSTVTGTAGFIQEGDTLTITVVLTNEDGTKEIKELYRHIPVIRTGTGYAEQGEAYTTLTLVIPRADLNEFLQYQEEGVIRPILESAFDQIKPQEGQADEHA